jgi:hypothetical protein
MWIIPAAHREGSAMELDALNRDEITLSKGDNGRLGH